MTEAFAPNPVARGPGQNPNGGIGLRGVEAEPHAEHEQRGTEAVGKELVVRLNSYTLVRTVRQKRQFRAAHRLQFRAPAAVWIEIFRGLAIEGQFALIRMMIATTPA